ncbi:MAG TPA: hypothetical protein VNI52_03065 [Sphingobacteriaceae bacterium]|nr:hypothetical protein [Sphingobacteriaceae bacterium]
MTGKKLFEHYTSKRDYSGSDVDRYADLLMTIWSNIFDKTYALLEKAEVEGKKLSIKPLPESKMILQDELTVNDIVLV